MFRSSILASCLLLLLWCLFRVPILNIGGAAPGGGGGDGKGLYSTVLLDFDGEEPRLKCGDMECPGGAVSINVREAKGPRAAGYSNRLADNTLLLFPMFAVEFVVSTIEEKGDCQKSTTLSTSKERLEEKEWQW